MRKFLMYVLILGGAAAAGFLTLGPAIADDRFNPIRPHDPYVISPEARALHDSLIVGDWHADSLLWNRDLLIRNDYGHVDIPRLIEGNVAFQVFTAVTKSPRGLNYSENAADAPDDVTLLAMAQRWPPRTWTSLLQRALYQSEKLHDYAEASENLMIIRTEADLDIVLEARANGQDMIGGILGIEGAHPLEGDLDNLLRLTNAGYRLVALQHFFDNELGGSLHGEDDHGLADFGREVVAAVEDRGLILDVAHSSPQVVLDVLDMIDMPIVLSHTGIFSHCPSPRNIADDLMRRIADTGGVVAIGYWRSVVCDDRPQGIADAIVAAVSLLGADHVSLGSDYDGTISVSMDTSELAALTQSLMQSGMTENDIAKVMGGNMLRVLRDRLD